MTVGAKPYSLRIPPEMSAEIKALALASRRSQHAMILVLLDGALRERRATEAISASAMTAYPEVPTVPTQRASQAVGVANTAQDHF